MSKNKSKGKSKKRKSPETKESPERRETGNTRSAESITVVWMLCIVVTLLASVVSVSTGLVIKWSSQQWPPTFQILPGLMLAIAAITGLLAIFLTYVTHRVRLDPPPLAIAAWAIIISTIPVVTIVALTVMS